MTLSKIRSLFAAIVLAASLALGILSMWAFSRIGPPPPPVTTFFGPGYARWQQERRVETMVGMGDAFALDYVNRVGIPASMGLALAALVLGFFGWPTRRLDRCLSVVAGVWLIVVFALSFWFGNAHRVGAVRGERGAVHPGVAAGRTLGSFAPLVEVASSRRSW